MGVAEVLEEVEEEIREQRQDIRSERNKEMKQKLRKCLNQTLARYKGILEIATKESGGVEYDPRGSYIAELFEEEPEKPTLCIEEVF